MAEIGRYLNTEPINCILFVIEQNPRINVTLKRLINIIVTKLHSSDHDKVALVVNQWSHSAAAKEVRSDAKGGEDEKSIKDARRDMIVQAFAGMLLWNLVYALS